MLIIVGYCLSYGLDEENTVNLEEGDRRIVGKYIIELIDIEMNPLENEIELIAYITLENKNSGEIVLRIKYLRKLKVELIKKQLKFI